MLDIEVLEQGGFAGVVVEPVGQRRHDLTAKLLGPIVGRGVIDPDGVDRGGQPVATVTEFEADLRDFAPDRVMTIAHAAGRLSGGRFSASGTAGPVPALPPGGMVPLDLETELDLRVSLPLPVHQLAER